jgi:hypothetical protein
MRRCLGASSAGQAGQPTEEELEKLPAECPSPEGWEPSPLSLARACNH